MLYIQIAEEHSTEGFYILMRDGTEKGSVKCLPNHVYGVNEEHLELLRSRGIPFKPVKPEELAIVAPDAYK